MQALNRLRGGRGPEEANPFVDARESKRVQASVKQDDREGRQDMDTRTATSSGTSSASTRCCMRTRRATRGPRKVKAASEEKAGKRATQKRTP